eukprot:CAMPEP_0118927640 /NCGR_PEP_ID=MMETSP1169-20130426/5067_1 /TAXON_ID=36882 /ORGANISM="Pyramimonas obovata, Strain CCMP722" /LENGTH=398 /DNA_ID=CAMNT_0006869447 /DNA_START=252 /DNA_END=1448 /DNA_ORIENTATION=+
MSPPKVSREVTKVVDTKNVSVKVQLGLDGVGTVHSDTGLPFLDHMIDQLGTHGMLDLSVLVEKREEGTSDEEVNNTVGAAIGSAIAGLGLHETKVQAEFYSPLDESLQGVSIDLSGNSSLKYDVTIPTKLVGRYETRLMEPFYAALVKEASIGVHIQRLTPAKNCNSHHIIEATFKAFARAMRQAIDKVDARAPQVDAVKGGEARTASTHRETGETSIGVEMSLDGLGDARVSTSIPLLDRQLAGIAAASGISLTVNAVGDTHIDDHHTVEDTAIVIGKTLQSALGDRSGINRMGFAEVCMGGAKVHATLDLSGRPHLGFDCDFPDERVGDYDTQLVEHTYQSLANNSGMTLHIRQLDGADSEELILAAAQAVGEALRMGIQYDDRRAGKIASSKGVL